ncbi:DUF3035 domain-containing protein [Pelagibacteraceae bacterium]|jgi:hypothetical protein|nr:DUF3035 domain-containing protein [Pelagibacteraceae bacterium]|tara:strand:+ start:93 stop:407 length:315 start_codon:yes stop_codon:yes gene_type:complete
MKFTKLLLIFYILTVLNSCGSLSEAGKVLRNQKSTSTDEFLVKKKAPLTQPPDYDVIPKPGSIKDSAVNDQDSIKKIMKTSKSGESNSEIKSTSTEQSILNQIK